LAHVRRGAPWTACCAFNTPVPSATHLLRHLEFVYQGCDQPSPWDDLQGGVL
jgi:hypothetical protein